MRRTPASEQYLQAQITLLLFTVYTILLCASIESASRFQEALENGCDLGAGGVSLWLELVVRHTADESLRYCPAHGFFCLPSGSSGLAALRFAS